MTKEEIKNDVRFWQKMLRLAGYEPGAIDGIRGPLTRAAEEAWERDARYFLKIYGYTDDRSEETLATLIPKAQGVMREWFRLVRGRLGEFGIDIKFIDGTRTYAEQNALYNKRPKVTNARGGYSWHNFGLAADFGLFKGGAYLGDSPYYAILGAEARNIKGLEWGGDWKSFVDMPHLQLNMFASTAAARKAFGEE